MIIGFCLQELLAPKSLMALRGLTSAEIGAGEKMKERSLPGEIFLDTEKTFQRDAGTAPSYNNRQWIHFKSISMDSRSTEVCTRQTVPTVHGVFGTNTKNTPGLKPPNSVAKVFFDTLSPPTRANQEAASG